MKKFDYDEELENLVNAFISNCLSEKQRNRLALYISLLREENQKQKEVIDKAIELLNSPWSFESGNEKVDNITYNKKREVIYILKGDSNG